MRHEFPWKLCRSQEFALVAAGHFGGFRRFRGLHDLPRCQYPVELTGTDPQGSSRVGHVAFVLDQCGQNRSVAGIALSSGEGAFWLFGLGCGRRAALAGCYHDALPTALHACR